MWGLFDDLSLNNSEEEAIGIFDTYQEAIDYLEDMDTEDSVGCWVEEIEGSFVPEDIQ